MGKKIPTCSNSALAGRVEFSIYYMRINRVGYFFFLKKISRHARKVRVKIFRFSLAKRSLKNTPLGSSMLHGRLNLESVTIAPHHLFAHENAPHFSPFILYDMFSSQLKKKIISGNSSCVYFDNRK